MATDEARKRRWELYRENFPAIFSARVDLTAGRDGCWPYLGSRRANGYGRLRVYGKHELAHRVAYWIAYAVELTDGQMVCHTCDNPPCCNPVHLFLGDHTLNMRDRSAKGRAPLHKAKLTENQVSEIKRRLALGELGVSLAKQFRVSPTAISRINTGRSWNIAALKAREATRNTENLKNKPETIEANTAPGEGPNPLK